MTSRTAVVALALMLLALVPEPAPAAPVTVTTVPRVAGINMTAAGQRYVSDRAGAVTLPDPSLIPRLRVLPTRLAPGVEARFTRWYRGRIALAYWYRIAPQFVGANGVPVQGAAISELRLHSSIGLRQVMTRVAPFWLQGTRIVPFPQGLRKKVISYAVDSVTVDGTNVVNRAQQHFIPATTRNLRVRLLFKTARISARDAIFKFPVGSGVRLEYPDGHVRDARFGSGASVVVPRLPRGQYRIRVLGGGWSPFRPVAVSRDQDVKLTVITYLDVAFGLALFAAICGGIYAYRRRHWRLQGRLVTLVIVLVAASASAAAAPAARASGPAPLYAYYYIWFDPSSWKRAKIDYPLLGRYSSDDTSVMRRQIEWAQAAGIDGFLVSWKNTETLDRRLTKLIAIAEQKHFQLGIVYQGLDFLRRPLPATRVARDLDVFVRKFAHNPAFSRFGKPVMIWSGTWKFTRRDIAAVTRGRRNHLRILASEKNANDYERVAKLVDGDAYYWSSVNPDTNKRYGQKLEEMGAAVHAHHGLWIPPAAPGFDARLVGGTSQVARRDGETLRVEMNAAEAAQPDLVGLISWNEFSENSYIEPSLRYRTRYLEVLAAINGRQVTLATDIDSSQPGKGGGGWQFGVLGLLCVGAAATLLRLRRHERPKRGRGAET